MNLRDLHYLLAVSDSLNFKQAAERCHVSQPTLSIQLRKLEDLLGVRLFERTNKKVLPTDAGRRIAVLARRIVDDEAQIHALARTLRDPDAGEFRLGAFPTLASYIFPHYVPALKAALPKLNLLLIEEKTGVLLEQLAAGKIDAALLALPIDDPALNVAPLFEDLFYLAVGHDHPMAGRPSVRAEDLHDHTLLLLSEGHCLRDQALEVCQSHGAREETSFRATSLETLRMMVQTPASGLMTLMPALAASPFDQLCYIPFRRDAPQRTIGLVWRKAYACGELMDKVVAALSAAKIKKEPVTNKRYRKP